MIAARISGKTGAASPGAAHLSLAATCVVALILLALHVVKPELDPSWRFLSEYAIGQAGWLMVLAFLAWAAACAALFVALRDAELSRAGRTGRWVLLAVAASLTVAGLFPQDPVTAGPDELTLHGSIHAIASMIGIPGVPLAALLISHGLPKRDPAWNRHRTLVLVAAHLTWLSLLAMAAYLGWAVPRAGGFNAEVWAGWMNRIVVATYLAWQATIAWALRRTAA